MRYPNARSFRQALADRLANLAHSEGTEIARLQRRVAFERFLARVYHQLGERLVLKGGYALELRLGLKARATIDLDFAAPSLGAGELLEELQQAGEIDLGDFFSYTLMWAKPPDLVGPPAGGYRFRAEARLDRYSPFATFVLDVGMGDVQLNPTEYLQPSVDLSFAGLTPVHFPVTPLPEHFAEKLHAYTRPRTARTRVKDLVDLMLMINQVGLQPSPILRETLQVVFERYDSHPLPTATTLEAPPDTWREPFSALMRELDLEPLSLELAHRRLVEWLGQLLRD